MKAQELNIVFVFGDAPSVPSSVRDKVEDCVSLTDTTPVLTTIGVSASFLRCSRAKLFVR